MCQRNNITKRKKKQHLTWEQRQIIEHLYNIQKLKITEIAVEMRKNKSTISREIKQGLVLQRRTNKYISSNLNLPCYTEIKLYDARKAQNSHDYKATNKGPMLKIANDHKLAKFIESELHTKMSPEVIADKIKKKDEFKTKICTNTIYSYLDKKVLMAERGDLTYGNYKKRGGKKKSENPVNALNKKGRTIHDRPPEVDAKTEVGHWEMDTVEGKNGKGEAVLLVLTERASNQEIIRKMDAKTQKCVESELNRIKRELGAKAFREKFKTITSDNGSEFLNWEGIEKSVFRGCLARTKLYYADAYCAWQRGANENANKMIRRFLPKGMSLNGIKTDELARIEHWMNNYPRKKFGFRTANDVYHFLAA